MRTYTILSGFNLKLKSVRAWVNRLLRAASLCNSAIRESSFHHIAILVVALLSGSVAEAGVVTLKNATATFSQSGFEVGNAIDAPTTTGWSRSGGPLQPSGWAIWSGGTPDTYSVSQTAVFETDAIDPDLFFSSSTTLLTFDLGFLYEDYYWGDNSAKFNLGRFRLSATTDDRSMFADGLTTGGDVTANWIVLDPISVISTDLTTAFTELSDNSLLANFDSSNVKQTYTVTTQTTLTNITGIRLEALEHDSLTLKGPGRFPVDGNFVLTNFSVDASPVTTVPEPTSLALLALGLAGLGFAKRRKQKAT